MKRRILSVLLALCLVVGLLPATALAEEAATYEEWTNDTSLPTTGTYKLMTDVTVAKETTVGSWASTRPETPAKTLVLDLNGHTITASGGQAFFIQVSGGLTIEDSVGTGKITNAGAGTMKTLLQVNGGAFTLAGGTLENTTSSGYALFVNSSSVATMTGGEVKNSVNGGKAVYVNGNAGVFEMTGGSVVQEGSYGSDSAIYANNTAKSVTISGGSITSNAKGVEAYFTPVTVTGGTIDAATYAFHTRNTTIPETSTVEVKAGTAAFYTLSNSENTVAAGSFDAPVLLKEYTAQESGKAVTVSGGTFTEPVSKEYCAESYASIIQADGSIIVAVPTDSMIENDDGTYYADDTAAAANNEAKIGDTYYATLAAAVEASKTSEDKTITLTKDVAVTSKVVLPAGVTLDGGNHKISAAGTWTTADHVLEVANASESTTTIKNITVEGSKKSGIHAYMSSEVVLENVTVNGSANAALIVNGGKVTATNLNTSGNAWGAVNVDKGGNFTLNSGNLTENAQIWSEDAAQASGSEITAPGMTEVTVNKAGASADDVKTHYTTDITKLGEAYNATTKTVYDTVERALNAAQSSETVQVINDATLDTASETTIKEGVILVVNSGVTLNTSDKLTNNGTIQNNGTIIGTVTEGSNTVTYVTVSFYESDTATVTTSYQVKSGDYITLPSASQAGYILAGWAFGTPNGNLYSVGASVQISSDCAFYAVWQAIYYPPVVPTNPSKPTTPEEPDEPDTWVNPYVDVSVLDWFYDEVAYVSAKGLMTGTTATTFLPNADTSRAMIWTVLGRMAGANVEGGSPWYAAAQAWAVSAGVSDGTEPNSAITREQLVTMLYRQAGSPEVGVSELARLGQFTDGESVSDWAEEAMAWAVSNGILTGDGDMLKPQGSATRAQVAAILARYCQNIQK